LVPGASPDAQTALSIFQHVRTRLSPYKRIRRLQFASLPKTISGKIRRVQLRQAEEARPADRARNDLEYWEADFQELS
jgi:acetyl-CoA synthetase